MDSYYNFKEQSKIKPDTAQRWAALAVKLTDRVENIQKEQNKSSKNILEEFEFKIKTSKPIHEEPTEIKHFRELNHTPDEE